jgi:ankyrin repeat protein
MPKLVPNTLRASARILAAVACVAAFASPAAADMYDDYIFAVSNDRVAQVKELLAKGVDPNAVAPNGEPVLVIAARAGYTGTVDALLAAKANVNARSKVGDTAIMASALSGHLDLVKKFRARGAEIDGAGWTPLIYAATGGQDAVVAYLLGEGANVNAVSPNGTSALMMAVREGKGSTVKLLLARGADVNLRNQTGATALSWALRGNEQEMAAALRRAGAKD